jgi:hypothetical protein
MTAERTQNSAASGDDHDLHLQVAAMGDHEMLQARRGDEP